MAAFTLVLSLVWVVSPSAAEQPGICAVVTVAADGQAVPPMAKLPALEVLDLHFMVSFNQVDGDYLLELAVHTPNDHLYQVLTAPISTTAAKSEGTRQVAGFPFPMAVQHLQQDSTGKKQAYSGAILKLPVAGTQIISGSLYGSWQVKPFIDGQPADCGELYRFTLLPPGAIFEDGFELGDTSSWDITRS
jgi:hypothetical protein